MHGLVAGLQYGDEGKGRVSAHFVKDYEWNVRFNGGPNAGHTVYHEGTKYALHHLPAGSVMGKKVALDAGMVLNLDQLKAECDKIGMDMRNLYISENAHIITPEHLDRDSEGSGVGSTKRGICYAYSDKALRKGVRVKDRESLDVLKTYRGLPPMPNYERALYESAQGIMLDVEYGHYPYVTSSSILPSYAHNISWTVGVMKAYTSRVGDGPPNLPTVPELTQAGDEFGTTTGRPRKCYWVIADEIEYAMSIVRPDEVVVTKLDILEGMDIHIWERGTLHRVGNLSEYKAFLVSRWPQIKYFSESPDGDLIGA